jgi:hypothetical protein
MRSQAATIVGIFAISSIAVCTSDKKSQTADDRAQNLHRPRRLRKVLHRSDERLGKRAAGAQLAFQLFELVAVGKLAVEQKMDDLFERRIGREIVDVVAAIR